MPIAETLFGLAVEPCLNGISRMANTVKEKKDAKLSSSVASVLREFWSDVVPDPETEREIIKVELEAAKLKNDDAAIYDAQARLYFIEKRYNAACVQHSYALEKEPDKALYNYHFATTLFCMNMPEKAAEQLKEAVRKEKGKKDAATYRARLIFLLLTLRRSDEAKELADQVTDEDDADSQIAKALVLWDNGKGKKDYENALGIINRAIELNAHNSSYLSLRGSILQSIGTKEELEQSQNDYQTALNIDNNVLYLFQLSTLQLDMGNDEEARKIALDAVEKIKGGETVVAELCRKLASFLLNELGAEDEAQDVARKAAELAKDSADAVLHDDLFILFRDLNMIDLALDEARKAVKADKSDNPLYLLHLAEILLEKERKGESLRQAKLAAEQAKGSKDAWLHYNIADLLLRRLKEPELARKEAIIAAKAEIGSEDIKLQSYLCFLLLELGEHELAAPRYEYVEKLNSV